MDFSQTVGSEKVMKMCFYIVTSSVKNILYFSPICLLPEASVHVALAFAAWNSGLLCVDAVAGLESVLEVAVAAVGTLVHEDCGFLFRVVLGQGNSGHHQAGEYQLANAKVVMIWSRV